MIMWRREFEKKQAKEGEAHEGEERNGIVGEDVPPPWDEIKAVMT